MLAGVGEQREAVGNDAADDLDDQERRGQRQHQPQRARRTRRAWSWPGTV